MSQRLLEKFTCPKCSSNDHFYVDVLATVHLNADGPSLAGDYFADSDCTCACINCGYEGKVFEFAKTAEVRP